MTLPHLPPRPMQDRHGRPRPCVNRQDESRAKRQRCAGCVLALGLLLAALVLPTPGFSADVSGPVVVAGRGPERPMIEDLARAFEKANPAAYVDIIWNKHAKTLHMVRSRQADLVVTGKAEPDLRAHQIAWDGLAIMVNASNTTGAVTTQQVADIFSGKVKFWSELGGPDYQILLITRHPTQNLSHAFEQALEIAGQIPKSAEVIGPEQKATNRVVGALPPYSAVTYMSLTPALLAVRTGAGVRLLLVDQVDPEHPTVKDGRYRLRRPVLLLGRNEPHPVADAFVRFALSPEGQRLIERSYTSLDQQHLQP